MTPRAEVDVLFLHTGQLTLPSITETVCYPVWEEAIRVEASLRTVSEAAAEARRSWSATATFLDARLVGGDEQMFREFVRRVVQPWLRDHGRLVHRLRADTARRHASHPSAAASVAPDLMAGRGGLLDLAALRWLDAIDAEHSSAASDALLRVLWLAEENVGQPAQRLSRRLQDRLSHVLGTPVLEEIFRHARWIAFSLDGALAPLRDDRQLGPSLALRDGQLVADRPPPLERIPVLGLRVASLVGLARPSADLLSWASATGPPIEWDSGTLHQLWLVLRAADWRAWDFLDVTGLLVRYLPELQRIWRKPGGAASGDLALDSHSFLALRRLHEWSERGDPLAERVWRAPRHRDWVYLAVLLHELGPEAASRAATRLGLPSEAQSSIGFAVANHRRVAESATRRDVNDEDLLLELATRIRTQQGLSTTFLVAAAHELASGPAAWSPWKADLMRQLFGRLESALRQPGEVGARRTRSIEHHRERIARELQKRAMDNLLPLVRRLPRRYILTHSLPFVVRHLQLLQEKPLGDGEVRMRAYRHRRHGLWEVLIAAQDRPGLLATVAGAMALRGASVLAADAATCSDGLVLDVFTVELNAPRWPDVNADVHAALRGKLPIDDLLGARKLEPSEAEAITVNVDTGASQFFDLVEVRAPDQVGLLYRIASALSQLDLDIHHARIATQTEGALDVFYVRDLHGEKLDAASAAHVAATLTSRLRGE